MPHRLPFAFRPNLCFGLLALVSFLALAPMAASAQQGDSTLSAADKAEIESLVRDYILNNPEIILQALHRLQARQQAEERARAEVALKERADDLFRDPNAPTQGPDDAAVTLVEFFDYQCSYCKRVFPDVMKLAEEQKDFRLVFKEFPILGPASEVASKAALAAHRQDLYLPFHRALMTLRGGLTQERIFDTAASVGIDVERLKTDMQDPAIATYIEEQRKLASALGITGTPAMVIGDQLIPGAISYEQMLDLVEAERAKAVAEDG